MWLHGIAKLSPILFVAGTERVGSSAVCRCCAHQRCNSAGRIRPAADPHAGVQGARAGRGCRLAVHTLPALTPAAWEQLPQSLCATRAGCPGATRSGLVCPGTDVTCTLARQTQPLTCFAEPLTQPSKLKKGFSRESSSCGFYHRPVSKWINYTLEFHNYAYTKLYNERSLQ